MTQEADDNRLRRNELVLIASLAFAKLLIHLVVNAADSYGIFRDELYYLACANHIGLGYVDQPPFSIYVLATSRALLGDSLAMIRVVPALAGAANVFLIGLIVRELGGRMFAIFIAGLSSIVSLIYLAMFSFYSMNAIDILIWTLSGYLLLRIDRRRDARLWIVLGLVLGIGLLNKIGVLWLGCGIAGGLLLARWRVWLRSPWPWLAAVIAGVVFLPYIIWNIQHDFAHLEFIRNATEGKYSGVTRIDFVVGMVLQQNPATLVIWTVGLWALLFSRSLGQGRILGVIFLVAMAILLANGHSKPEYLSAAYGPLFAAGGVMFERWLSSPRAVVVRVLLSVGVASGILLAPITLPILPVEQYLNYARALGIRPSTAENLELAELPQFYADRFGWEEKAKAVAEVYHKLSPQEQKVCAIYSDNYGRCGAIDYYGRRYGLPSAIGSHNSYWIWGPGTADGSVVIILGGALKDKQQSFEEVEVAGQVTCRYCMPYENNLTIYLCRHLRKPIGEVWPGVKHFM